MILEKVVSIFLALSILPAMSELSGFLLSVSPVFSRLSGPLQFLKLGLPFFILWIIQKRKIYSAKTILGLASLLLIGTISTVTAGYLSGFPPLFLREWFVICAGFSAALSFHATDFEKQKKIVLCWMVIVLSGVILNLVSNETLNHVLETVFNKDTRWVEETEVGQWVLSGWYGRQSLAKVLTWLPWITLVFWTTRKNSLFTIILGLALPLPLILMTAQRGAGLAYIFGVIAFILHRGIHLRKWSLIFKGFWVGFAVMGICAVIIPETYWKQRFLALFDDYMITPSPTHVNAVSNRIVRKKIAALSFEIIQNHPFGKPLVTEEDHRRHGIWLAPMHSHSLILEQFRSRGWIWGFCHFLLWVCALFSAAKKPDLRMAFVFAGLVSVFLGGLFDHPWFVLHHSLLIWVLLLFSFPLLNKRKAG